MNSTSLYSAGRLVWSGGQTALVDRLGSVRVRATAAGTWTETHSYFPYGQERATSANGRDKFGTYYRDGTGFDYADQRYYANQWGRFLTPDPYRASGGPGDPGSWNRYA